MRSLRLIGHGLLCACALLFAASGCEQFDPVRTKSLCDGPGPISMRCQQCLEPPFDERCSKCRKGEVDPDLCSETEPSPSKNAGRGGGGTEAPPTGGAGETGVAGEGEAGEGGAAGMDGGEGQAGESGSGGMSQPAGGQGGAPPMASNVCTDHLWCSTRDSQRRYCDAANKRCVECLDNAHCGPGRVCNLSLQRCQECTVDSDCASMACDEATHVCVDCKKDTDCKLKDPMSEKDSCDTRTFSCVDCVNNGGCADDVRGTCDTGAFTCVDCLNDIDCEPGKPACDKQTRACVPCITDDHCEDAVLGSCDTPNRKCVDCVDNRGCIGGANTQCDTKAQKCVQCLAPSDCPSKHCLAQKCVACEDDGDCPTTDKARCDPSSYVCAPCTSNANCMHLPETSVCDTGSGKCVQCNDDNQCGGTSCIRASHKCSTVPVRSLAVCQACQADTMCGTGMRCVSLNFGEQSTGSYCVFQRSMRPGQSCNNARPYTQMISRNSIDNSSTSFCIPPSTTSCPGVLSVSRGASGDSCETSSDCGLGIGDASCTDMRCTYVCGGLEINCPEGLTCLQGGLCG